jgi:dimethylamine/trimethylamine dehydrogenase
MECAVVLGKRGFSAVHLVEAEAEIGGRLRWTRRLPTLGDWGRITDWRAVQLGKLPGVKVITGRRVSAPDALDYGADIVVIATGSSWRGDGVQPGRVDRISGADAAQANVLTPEQVAAGKRPAGRNVIVYDTDGYYVAPGVAELLAAEGFSVTVVTTFPVLSPVSDETLEGEMLRADVHRRGIAVRRGLTITSIEAGSVRGHDEHGEPWSLRCDGVVLVTQQASDDRLYQELAADEAALARAGIQAVHVIGDAVAPRIISEAVFDGHRLAREIDRPDPSRPAPYRREHPDLTP